MLQRLTASRREFFNHVHQLTSDFKSALSGNRTFCQDFIFLVTEESSRSMLLHYGLPDKLSSISRVLKKENLAEDEAVVQNELSFATEGLIVYLNNHVYSSPSYGSFTAGFSHNLDDNAKADMFYQVKAEIRSVKGAVLNMYCLYNYL